MEPKARAGVLASAAAVGAALLLAAGFASVRASQEPRFDPELATYMSDLQHHTHKLTLSIAAENPALARFYLHEVQEIAEQIETLFPEHDGVPVARLVHELLDPRLAGLGETLKAARWNEARSGLANVITACNSCHAAAGHAFIRVEVTTANPFNQSFSEAPRSAP